MICDNKIYKNTVDKTINSINLCKIGFVLTNKYVCKLNSLILLNNLLYIYNNGNEEVDEQINSMYVKLIDEYD